MDRTNEYSGDTFWSQWVKCSSWDESIPMSIASDTSILTPGPPFMKLTTPKSITLFEYNAPLPEPETAERELQTVVQEADATGKQQITIQIETFGPVVPSKKFLSSLGFVEQKGQQVRIKNIANVQNSNGSNISVPVGFEILKVSPDSGSDWTERLDIEIMLFGYPPAHAAKLSPALEYMHARGDEHYIVKHLDRGVAAGYMTMRYTHGLAYLQGAGVLEEYRKKGLTRALLNVCVGDAKRKGFTSIATTGWNDAAEKAWEAMGRKKRMNAPAVTPLAELPRPVRMRICGLSGSGKSTLAARLADKLGLAAGEEDAWHFTTGRDFTVDAAAVVQQRARAFATANAARGFVTDGFWRDIHGVLLPRVNVVVALDYPLGVVLWRLVVRTFWRCWTKQPLWDTDITESFLQQAQLWHEDNIFGHLLRSWWHARFGADERGKMRELWLREGWPLDPDSEDPNDCWHGPRYLLKFKHPRELEEWLRAA
ncbi:hypothetical protein HK100_002462 [Physocladia obscura]|uniref:N-acetyltransferase domain-containing protein n=1 Tax=Physocladia obscura TaxID=109957 RepID=A0AAD5SWC1_9FUNG|nr:hypothetical protein HK100_002462 [Physocladia obscura]